MKQKTTEKPLPRQRRRLTEKKQQNIHAAVAVRHMCSWRPVIISSAGYKAVMNMQ